MSLEQGQQDLSRYSFPHLDDTAFPLLENVDVYDYKNDFDYSRWTDTTKIYLCNVLWNNDYRDVVKFENDEKRDAYFNSLDGYTVELTSAFNVAPDGTVKVPVPYQVATRYNYLYVDLPIMTSDEEPINYEDTRRTRRYYYFINGIAQNAPSSTTLIVALDNWTTYINNVQIPYIMLERGHAPMAAIKTDTYLANPIANNQYLLAPDFDFSNGNSIVANSKFVPINNKEKYILFATTMSISQITSQTYPTPIDTQNTPPTYADYDARWGYQYTVNDYVWGIGGYNYDGMYTNSTPFQSAGGSIPNNTRMVAVKASDAASMFSIMQTQIPFFFKTIKACFMVDSSMFAKGTQFTFCGVTCWIVNPAADSVINTLSLAKADFGYDSKYAEITKLYTSPYATIEVTDNNGISKSFKIENTSSVQVHQATALAFPYISIQAYLTGIDGSGSATYTWQNITASTNTRRIYADDWGDYLWDWEIPTYALSVRGYDDAKASTYPKQSIDRYNAIAEYHKTVSMANTQYENAKDGADTTQTMTNNSADVENTNAVNMANTIKTNNDASASTAKTNADNSALCARDNTNNQAQNLIDNNKLDITRANQNNGDNLIQIGDSVVIANKMNLANQAWDAGLSRAVTGIENTQATVNGVVNAVSGYMNGQAQGIAAIGNMNLMGAVSAAIEGWSNVASAGISTWVTVAANSAMTEATIQNTEDKTKALNQNNNDQRDITRLFNSSVTTNNVLCSKSMTENTRDMMNENATRTKTMENTNAANTKTTSNSNNSRTNTTSVANANRTQTNAKTNSKLNRDTTVSNANYTRLNAVKNAKISLEQRRISNRNQYYSYRLAAPVEYGATTGDPTLDAFERRGLQIKIRTQAKGEIAQAGDLMLRYGYALNQVWNVMQSGYVLMKHFTYWKAADIWINEGSGVNQDAQKDIQRAFENGVTIWSNPDEIGKVSIYDNWN